MYLFKRAILYLKKQRAKTILLLLLFFILANIVLSGLSISAATEKTKVDIRQQLGATVTYTIDATRYNTDLRSGLLDRTIDVSYLQGAPTVSNALLLTDYPYLVGVDFIATIEANALDIQAHIHQATTLPLGGGGSKEETSETVEVFNVSIKTFTSMTPSDFNDQSSTLLAGRFATTDEIANGALVAIIESTLALNNQIGLNDTITVVNHLQETMTITVIGIYQTNVVIDDRLARTASASFLPQNQLYMPFLVLSNFGYDEQSIQNLPLSKAVYQLSDPMYLQDFAQVSATKVPLTYGTLDLNDALYNQLVGPVDQLSTLSNYLVWIVIIAGAGILGLITALTVNQRKNEIGILLAIGESKGRVLTQLIVEVGLIVVVAFLLSTVTGTQVASMISNQVSLDQPTTTQAMPSQSQGRGSASRLPSAALGTVAIEPDVDVRVDVALNVTTLLQLFGAGLLITILGVSIPAINITRFKPKQILSNTI